MRPQEAVAHPVTIADPEARIAGKQLVFLVGAPRSGTTWLQLLLSGSDKVATTLETMLFSHYMSSLFKAWDNLSSGSHLGLHKMLSPQEYFLLLRQFAAAALARVTDDKPTATVILEKTPSHTLCLPYILRLFPEAHIIHIIRDPRSVVASMLDANKDWGHDFTDSSVPGNCAIWSRHVMAGRHEGAAARHYVEVRYEQLKSHPRETLQPLFNTIGVDVTPAEIDGIIARFDLRRVQSQPPVQGRLDLSQVPERFFRKGVSDGWKQDLTPAQARLIEVLLREEMQQLGYQPEAPRCFVGHLLLRQHAITLFERLLRRVAGDWRLRKMAAE